MKKSVLLLALFSSCSFGATIDECYQMYDDGMFFRTIQRFCGSKDVIKNPDPIFLVDVSGSQVTGPYVKERCASSYGDVLDKKIEASFPERMNKEYEKYKDNYDYCEAITPRYKKLLSLYLSYPDNG